MELAYAPSRELRRRDRIYTVCCCAADVCMHLYYNIEYSGFENIPKQGPVLLLPKHQYLQDIPLEGFFLKNSCGRQGNWIMKNELVGILKYLGGIKVERPKNIIKIKDKEKRRKIHEKAKKQNQEAMEYVEWLFKNGEIVVVHPEGTRMRKEMGRIRTGFIDLTRRVQESYGLKIPVIPMGIEYSNVLLPRSRISVRAGEPLNIADPDIVTRVEQEIRRLSRM